MSVEHLLRRDLAALEPYPPPPTIEMLEERLGRPVVKLDANENPYGPSPRVHEALSRCNVERYPDAGCTRLRELLGAFLPTDPERIVCTVGGDELLDLITRLFLEPGNEAIDCTPSFAMYHVTARANGGRVVDVPRGEGFAVDLDGVLRALTDRTKIIFLCSPNNPTGNPTPRAHIERLLETDRILVLDEAYAEFAGRTLVPLAERYRNLVVLRTMSKWAALAGIRLGYAVMDPLLIAEMTKLKAPYNVSSAAQAAGIASLEDAGYLMGNVRRIVEERERLFARLQALPYGHVYPSETNFLYWRLPFGNARAWRDAMIERGVLIRALRKPVQALRFSVGLREESEALLAALEEVHALMAEGVEAHG